MLKQIDISGGHPTVYCVFGGEARAQLAAWAAHWCAVNASAAWCIAPDHRGELEVTFARSDDVVKFQSALLAQHL